jgi:hypothetical protein
MKTYRSLAKALSLALSRNMFIVAIHCVYQRIKLFFLLETAERCLVEDFFLVSVDLEKISEHPRD